MTFDMFCPIRSSKSSRRSTSHKANRSNNYNGNSNNNNNNVNSNNGDGVLVSDTTNGRHHTTTTTTTSTGTTMSNTNASNSDGHNNLNNPINTPYRYVNSVFHAVALDELSVNPGDFVLVDFEDVSDGQTWCHVQCLNGTKMEGFVPKDILSIEPRFPRCKKKLPRSSNHSDPLQHHLHHHHHHGGPHSHTKANYASEKMCHSNGGSIRGSRHFSAHMREHQPPAAFDLPPPNSLQGSSGCQTFQKGCNDLCWASVAPSYHNVIQLPPGHQYDSRYMLHIRPFYLDRQEEYFVAHNFVAREENDLSVKTGDQVVVLNKDDKDWFWVRLIEDRSYRGEEGFVPSSFIHPREKVNNIVNDLNKGNSMTATMKSSNQCEDNFHTYINHRPDRESLPTEQS